MPYLSASGPLVKAALNALTGSARLNVSAIEGAQPLNPVLTATTASFTTAQETKLAGVAIGATANATDAQLRDRSTHTGTQAISTVEGLQAALDAAGTGGGGEETGASIVTKLTALTGVNRLPITAIRDTAIADVSGLQTALDGKQPLTTVLTNTTASFTTALNTKLTGIATGATANSTDAQLRDRSTHTGTQATSTITGLDTALAGKQATLVSATNIKTVNGVSLLGSGDIVIAGGGGSGVWGAITGTLSSQTDLQTALDARQPLAAVLTGTTASFTTALNTKLSGIATGATANSTDATLLARANHTGTQATSTITGLDTALSGKAATVHTHAIADVTSLQTTLDAKQPLAAVLTGTTASFTTALNTKLTGIATGATANSTDAQLRDRSTHTGAQAISTITGLQAAIDGKQAAGTYITGNGSIVQEVALTQAAYDALGTKVATTMYVIVP